MKAMTFQAGSVSQTRVKQQQTATGVGMEEPVKLKPKCNQRDVCFGR